MKILVKAPGAGGIVPLFTIGVTAEGVAAVWNICVNSPGAGAFGMGMA